MDHAGSALHAGNRVDVGCTELVTVLVLRSSGAVEQLLGAHADESQDSCALVVLDRPVVVWPGQTW